MPTRQDAELAARLFRGLSDPTRLGLLTALTTGERTVSDLVKAVDAGQPNVSAHLACLRGCGLVTSRPGPGRTVLYRLAVDSLVPLLHAAEHLLADTGEQVALCPAHAPETP
ncbi:ArsR/SmtB family transcription factor [Virgisporangium ochraceum]|uniref:ArsR/SmtB family transcription factor n=1 Tax=Virgisporangium ochraceum TaxID=65505 RepID=UPI0035A25EE3